MIDPKAIIRKVTPRSLRNWLRSPTRSIAYLGDRLLYRIGSTRTVTVRDDWHPRVHPAAQSHFDVFRTDPVQAAELDSFVRHCPLGIQLLDIGAHYGFFAVAATRYGGPQARVICVEASPGASQILRSTLQLNGCENQVQLFNVAMGDADGTLRMLSTGPLAGDYFVVPTEDRSDVTELPQRSLESLLSETKFEPTHIKLDIEGYEYEVIDAAADVLRRLRPVLFLELHGDALRARRKDPRRIISMLRAAGYSRFEIDDGETLSEPQMADKGFNVRMVCQT